MAAAVLRAAVVMEADEAVMAVPIMVAAVA